MATSVAAPKKPKLKQTPRIRVQLDEAGVKLLNQFYAENPTPLTIPPTITKAYYPTINYLGYEVNGRKLKKLQDLNKLFFEFPNNFVGKKQQLVRHQLRNYGTGRS
jgi:hypothetical protein